MKTAIRRHRLLLASVALGASALVLSYATLSPYVRSAPVVVALRDLEPYERISPGDVALVQIPVKAVPRSSFTRTPDVAGAYTRSRLVAGQIIMAGHLASGRDGVGLSYDLPPDKRGFFLPLEAHKALGGALKAGERVDVICASKGGSSWPGGTEPAAVTALRDLTIVEVARDVSTGELLGVMVFARPSECEALARFLESASVYLSLAPRVSLAAAPEPEVWPTR